MTKTEAQWFVFSAAERDRRWAAIRAIMAEPQWDLDAILAGSPVTQQPARPGGHPLPGVRPNASVGFDRYLTQIAGAEGVIFPRDPSSPVELVVPNPGAATFWEARGFDQWTADGALGFRVGETVETVIDRLSALGVRRVGVAELEGSRFNPMGFMPARYLEALTAALPEVEFVPIERWQVDPPDPGPLAASAMVKGPEEQEVLRACVGAGEAAIEQLLESARDGAETQADLWYQTYWRMFTEIGEEPGRVSIALDVPGYFTVGVPTADPLREGQIIGEELSARFQGYGAQVNHSIFVGSRRTPGHEYYETAVTLAIRAVEDAIEFINRKPGCTVGELLTDFVDNAEARGAENPFAVIHTDGIAPLTRPRIAPEQVGTGQDDNIKIVPGMAFDFKAIITLRRDFMQDAGPTNRPAEVGENILVTENGATRLGSRELVPLCSHE